MPMAAGRHVSWEAGQTCIEPLQLSPGNAAI